MAEEWVHPELRNLAEDLDKKELAEIAQTCLEEYKQDDDSRSGWLSMHAEWLKLYFQKDNPKNPPWDGASTESLPLLAEACNQFHARAYPALFPGKTIVEAYPVGRPDPASKERAGRISKHMSWQLLVKNRGYKRDKDRLLLSTPLHGSYFTKTYYDPVKKKNMVENVRAVDLVVPYGTGPRNIEDIERKTHVIWTSVNKTRILAEQGFFLEPAEPLQDISTETKEPDRAHNDIQGQQETEHENKTVACILEQHRLLDLDGDDIEEPYIVWVDKESEKVLRIAIRYDTDELGDPTDNKEPVEYFTHYTFLENPDGFYGLGEGHLIGKLNTAVNKLLRQSVDAGTLANIGNMSGFISDTLDVQGGELRMQLGKFAKIRGGVEDIAKGIYQFKFPGANTALLQIMELLMGRSDRLAMVTEALTGETDKVMQPTTIMALIEQGLQVFSAAFERMVTALSEEYMKLYRLNGKFMDPKEYFSVMDVTGDMAEESAGRDDYKPDMQVVPVADPRQVTKQQKLAKAQAEYQTLMSNPLVMQSPLHIYNATRRFLEAIESEDINEVLPQPPNNLPKTDDPTQENMGAMLDTPMVPMAFPDQDHKEHIQAHQMALTNPRIGQAGYYALGDHIQQHLRFMGYGGTGLNPMAQTAGNAMGSPNVEGAVQPGGGFDMGSGVNGGNPLSIEGPAGSIPGSGNPLETGPG